jgi:hypothetical protein
MRKVLEIMILLVALTSCDDKLDVKPTQSIDQNNALTTEKDVLGTLIGAYDGLQEAEIYGGDFMTLSELIGNSEDILFTGTFAALSDIWRLQTVTTNTNVQETRARVEGEALFIRASIYFELIRFYAKTWDDGDNALNPGVPLVLEPTTLIGEEDYRSRNSVAEVYEQIISDLTTAESLLPSGNGIYATKTAAAAIFSRVKLMQGAYGATPAQIAALEAARNAANRALAYNTNSLEDNFASLWRTFLDNAGNSPDEYIFSMKVTTQDGTNAMNTYFGTNAGPGTAGRSDCKITPAHRAKYEDGDVRKNFFVTVGGRDYTRKHLDRYGNVPVVRLAEMYLTRAETNFRLETAVGADPLDDLNVIRERAGLDPLASIPSVEAIVKERYLELAFEGSRLHDIKRTRGTAGSVAWNDPLLIFPIPQREIDVNTNLDQNDAYQ